MSPKRWLMRNTIVLLISAFVVVITVLLAAVLTAGQDAAAAGIVRGALWVAVVVFLGGVLIQLGLLTWLELNRPAENPMISTAPPDLPKES